MSSTTAGTSGWIETALQVPYRPECRGIRPDGMLVRRNRRRGGGWPRVWMICMVGTAEVAFGFHCERRKASDGWCLVVGTCDLTCVRRVQMLEPVVKLACRRVGLKSLWTQAV